MLNSKKISKILVSLVLILVTSFSIVFVAMQVNKTNNDANLSVSAVSDLDISTNGLSLIEPYGIMNGMGCEDCKSNGTAKRPYHESPWYGRIKCLHSTFSKRYSNRMYTLEVNVDVRDIKLGIPDDVIVEFKFYYQEGTLGLKKSMKVSSLSINAKFYSNGTLTANPIRNCHDKSSAGFTISGADKTDEVKVIITYYYNDDYYSANEEINFLFSSKCPPPPEE